MPRYKLTIAYDGTDFSGWQKQEPLAPPPPGRRDTVVPLPTSVELPVEPPPAALAPPPPTSKSRWPPDGPPPGPGFIEPTRPGRLALRTVQGVLEQAAREVVREPAEVRGSSRTDAGVHARGQAAAFTCSGDGSGDGSTDGGLAGDRDRGAGWPIARGTRALVRAVNARLPHDVLVLAADPVPLGFDPVTDCTSKAYSYTLHLSRDRPLWDRRYVTHLWTPLDAGLMQAAADRLVGEHDFAAFAAAGHGRLTTVRTVLTCRVTSEGAFESPGGQRVRIEISGSGFLYNMVRIIAGTLVEVGRGRMTPDGVAAVLAGKDRRRAGPTMPPEGLCLEWVRYPGESAAATR